MKNTLFFLFLMATFFAQAQQINSGLLSIDRIFQSDEFQLERFGQARWIEDGEAYTTLEASANYKGAKDVVRYETSSAQRSILINAEKLIPKGAKKPLSISNYIWSKDKNKLLIFTNTKRVWRRHTKGDYWVLDLKTEQLHQLGKSLPASSLMFAKFSPDGSKAAYVSEHNLFVENLKNGSIRQLTKDGSSTLINGTFDWAYEEEFGCRDGFRWSPDGKKLLFGK